ncbi:MAG: tRNA pseudouridine(38-40) synthase TruA [Magnetococcales bacterium]|nr:tRNA pseudouridine(38-40) synthase TruA [Magnetococcales bacterium]
MARFRLLLEYDGSGFYGWQRQPDGLTIQGALEEALGSLCGHAVQVTGSGRTDSGVHALGQVAHFDTSRPRSPEVYVRALNALTPKRISIRSAEAVGEDFHARFQATYREYHYRLLNRSTPSALDRNRVWHLSFPLDIQIMIEALSLLKGTHDFSAFRAAACQAKSPIRTLYRGEIIQQGDELRIILGANAFLQHMVRNIVGSLVLVGRGGWDLDRFQEVFESRDRTQAAATAPPVGLYLARVTYGEVPWKDSVETSL